MRFFVSLLCVAILFSCGVFSEFRGDVSGLPALQILGIAQDAGRPQLNCKKDCCRALIARGVSHPVASLAIVGDSGWWLVDATPDIVEQIHSMGSMPHGIFLTHGHMGHYTGLMQLGFESMNADRVPVYCSRSMAGYLRHNAPWSQLVDMEQIILREVDEGVAVVLEKDLQVVPYSVRHRAEHTNTFAWNIERANGRRALWLPDLDKWLDDGSDLRFFASEFDYLFIDGTFFSREELPLRGLDEIPHPLIGDSMKILEEGFSAKVYFIHLNHSNPVWDRSSWQFQTLRDKGFFVPNLGQRFSL